MISYRYDIIPEDMISYHVQHIYMFDIYTCSTYIHVGRIYMFKIYRVYIQYTYMSKNTVSFKKWTYIWPIDVFISLKLINFQNDLRIWPFWGPEISFFIIFFDDLVFLTNIFLKICFCIFIFYFMVYLRINNPEN